MTSFYQSLTVNTEVSHVVYVRASCLQGVLLARNLLELLFEGTADKMDGALRNLLILSSYSP